MLQSGHLYSARFEHLYYIHTYILYLHIHIYIYVNIIYRSKPTKNQTSSEMDGKICQNIKPPTPTHIPFSVQLSTWGRLQD